MENKQLQIDPVIEQRILGAILFNNELFNIISHKINENIFYFEKNQMIWSILAETIGHSEKIDMIHLLDLVRRKDLSKIITAGYIAEVANSDSLDINRDVNTLQKDYFGREYTKIDNEANTKIAIGEDPYDVSKWHQDKIDTLFILNEDEGKSLKTITIDAIEDLRGRKEGTMSNRLLTNSQYDKVIDISPRELIWLAGLSKMGKTKNLINIIYELMKIHSEEVSVFWASMEDDPEKILRHFLAIETGIDLDVMEGKKDVRITDDEFDLLKEKTKIFEDWDISIDYGSYSVEYVAKKSKAFSRTRKTKHCVYIFDNFNILKDNVERGTDIQKENFVAGKLQQLHLALNKNGLRSTIIVLDHLNKSALSAESVKSGFRATEGQLSGSGRKSQIMTQLLFLNKLSRFGDSIYNEYNQSPDKMLSDGKEWTMKEILNKLTILEVILSREAVCEPGIPIRTLADLGTMQFTDFEEMKKAPSQESIDAISEKEKEKEGEAQIIDFERQVMDAAEEEKDEGYEAPF